MLNIYYNLNTIFVYVMIYILYVNHAIKLRKYLDYFLFRLLFLLFIFAIILKKTEINIIELISDFGEFSHSKSEQIRGC